MTGTPTDVTFTPDLGHADLETVRNACVEAYNARDRDATVQLGPTGSYESGGRAE